MAGIIVSLSFCEFYRRRRVRDLDLGFPGVTEPVELGSEPSISFSIMRERDTTTLEAQMKMINNRAGNM